jgi:hypothetical protein
LAQFLAALMRILLGAVVPHFLELTNLFREATNVLMPVLLVEGHGLFTQSFQRQEMLDTAINTSFLIVGQVVLQENTLLANLSEIETAIEDGQQIGMLGGYGCRCPKKLGHGRFSNGS